MLIVTKNIFCFYFKEWKWFFCDRGGRKLRPLAFIRRSFRFGILAVEIRAGTSCRNRFRKSGRRRWRRNRFDRRMFRLERVSRLDLSSRRRFGRLDRDSKEVEDWKTLPHLISRSWWNCCLPELMYKTNCVYEFMFILKLILSFPQLGSMNKIKYFDYIKSNYVKFWKLLYLLTM